MPVDLYWNLDEDYAIGEDGDLKQTSFDLYRSLWQEIRTRVMSNFQDWREHPNLGANLDNLLGRPNNRLTAEEGKASIIASLTMGGLVPKAALNVKYVPISRHRLMYIIEVRVSDATTGQTRMLKTQLVYDTIEGQAMVI